jgi:hypothetical protein
LRTSDAPSCRPFELAVLAPELERDDWPEPLPLELADRPRVRALPFAREEPDDARPDELRDAAARVLPDPPLPPEPDWPLDCLDDALALDPLADVALVARLALAADPLPLSPARAFPARDVL